MMERTASICLIDEAGCANDPEILLQGTALAVHLAFMRCSMEGGNAYAFVLKHAFTTMTSFVVSHLNHVLPDGEITANQSYIFYMH